MSKQLLDGFIGELLHINDVSDNKLIDLGANGGRNTYFLSHTGIDQSAYTLGVIAERKGKTGNTILLNSALASGAEQRVSRHINTFAWRSFDGTNDVKSLHAFIANARKELNLRGNNPLFLSVGALRWRVSVQSFGKEVSKEISTPLLIFPIRLIVTANSAPVSIEFSDEETYVNPCLIAKLAQIYGEELAEGFPKPDSVSGDDSVVDLKALGDGDSYFNAVKAYVDSCNRSDGDDNTLFEFEKDVVAISQYNHSELCTYYDIRRNRDKIEAHPLIEKLFSLNATPCVSNGELRVVPKYILPYDSVQADIITRAVNGESMVIKGPPGTGKTITIANMIAALLSENKKVMFASKKLSALNEVYAKLPESLRKFTMLLDSETESKAAKINPAEVKQDFKRLITACKEYKEPASLEQDASHAMAQRAKLLSKISAYIDLMFNQKCICGDSFYSAMDAYCKVDMPVVPFANPALVAQITREQYNKLHTAVEQTSQYLPLLTANGAHSIWLCPWFNVNDSCDVEKAIAVCKEVGDSALLTQSEVCSALSNYLLQPSKLSLNVTLSAMRSVLPEQTVIDVASNDAVLQMIDGLEDKLKNFQTAYNQFGEGYALKRNDETDSTVIGLNALTCDRDLKLSEVKTISKNSGIFLIDGKNFAGEKAIASLIDIVQEIVALSKRKSYSLGNSQSVFKSGLDKEQSKTVAKYAQALAPYNSRSDKPKTLDFKAKKAYSVLCGLSFLNNPSFGEIVLATSEYYKALELQSQIDEKIELIYRCFRKRLTEDELACALTVASNCTPDKVYAYVRDVVSASDLLFKSAEQVGVTQYGEVTVGQLIGGFECGYRHLILMEELNAVNAVVPVWGEGQSVRGVASSLCALKRFGQVWGNIGGRGEDVSLAFNALHKLGERAVHSIENIIVRLEDFGKEFFNNYYAVCGGNCTFEELEILANESDNRDVIGAAVAYSKIKHDKDNPLPISEFLYPFEKGEITLPEGVSLADAFEHSFFALAIEQCNKLLGVARNGLGSGIESDLEKLGAVEDEVNRYNVDIIESRCLRRIKPEDSDFIFIQDNNPGENLRLMFKKHGNGILKLKKCMILSPYTASLLFRTDEFSNFDVLIVDEASQLEPALMLPVMFRSKQCIIVGDEWQMPPIKHFVTLSPVTGDEEEGYGSLEPEISALGLALRCEGFPVRELICHYRSKTESLIKFSQKLFYPNMRTFPAPVPARLPEKGVAGLGFKDVYVPEGIVSKGVNLAEAERVVEELRLHFDRYFDEKSKTLSMSVGVVAFGELQCAAILAKVKSDVELNRKITQALEHFDDLPEKLIFFKTIETVQGQEIGHLILSLTHGKRSSGLHMSFGQLNSGKLGRCIFNVAVTRAQNMVTLIHSVRPQEITADSVSYIREYLETVERFCTVGREQFVSCKEDCGFIYEVANFICSQGISRDRVVFNYGVTDGSVRIPIAVLSPDLKQALLGVWCEKPVGGKYDYLDYNLRYISNLIRCGWKIHSVFIHDWVDNGQKEKNALIEALNDIK